MYSKCLILLISILQIVSSSLSDNMIGEFKKSCENSYSLTCLKLDLVSFIDDMGKVRDYNIIPGINLVQEHHSGRSSTNTAQIVSEINKEHPNDPDARLNAFVVNKLGNYLNTHSLKFDLWNAQSDEAETGRKKSSGLGGGGKKGGGLGMILAMGAMMKGTLMAFGMAGLAAIAGKALMTALVSLVLSAVIGIKSLTSGGHKSTTYEVVAKPIHSHEDSHSSYGRNLDFALPPALQNDHKAA